MWEADRVELIEDCVRWLEHEQEDELTRRLPLVAVEARFGQRHAGEKRGSLSRSTPVEIELASGPLLLHGRIDRVSWDRERSCFRVVDYKTGKVYEEKPAQLQGGRMLQLPLYVLAASSLLGIDPRRGSAAYVYPTRRGDFKTVDWSSEEMQARDGELLALLDAILTSVRAGDFIAAPYEGACDWCTFKDVCVGATGDYAQRKAGDERLVRLESEIRSVP
jgi:RecB family exonuclease